VRPLMQGHVPPTWPVTQSKAEMIMAVLRAATVLSHCVGHPAADRFARRLGTAASGSTLALARQLASVPLEHPLRPWHRPRLQDVRGAGAVWPQFALRSHPCLSAPADGPGRRTHSRAQRRLGREAVQRLAARVPEVRARCCAPAVCPSPAASLVLTLQLCVQAAAGHRQAPEL
jgi:hypothetical protein